MSGTDYTLTSTLGLYKPIANMAVGLWGDLWNSNADAIDAAIHFASGGGPFLPLAGGNVFGPLNYTATSGTVARSAQDRAADVANVLDYGADPTGVADSTAAFNAAIAARSEVYIPGGSYKLLGAVTLKSSTILRGAGMATTCLTIPATFNMSALGVLVFDTSGPNPGFTAIRDLWIRFTQPNFNGMTRSDLIQYPPAIYKGPAPGGGRPVIERVQITSAWIGLSMDNCAGNIDTLMMSALHQGILWSPTSASLDVVRINNLHFWGFDLPQYVAPLFTDGTTQCAWFGRVDGLFATGFFSESSIVTIDNTASPGGGYYFFETMVLDGPAQLIINGAINCQIDELSNNRAPAYTTPAITVNGGRVSLANSYLAHSATATSCVVINGGGLNISGGCPWFKEAANSEMITITGGSCSINGVGFASHTATHTAPFIHQSGTGILVMNGCTFGPTGTAVAVQMDTTVAGSQIGVTNYYGTLTTAGAGFTTGVVTVGGNTAIANQSLNINSAAGHYRRVIYATNGLARWSVGVDNTAEGGANAGSNFTIGSQTDAGGNIASNIILNRATGTIALGGAGSWTANGSVAVSLTALGPAGAHATVQEWLTITDAAGNVRYIPCF